MKSPEARVAQLFPAVSVAEVLTADSIRLQLDSDVFVNCIRDPQSGVIKIGNPAIEGGVSDSDLLSRIGNRWRDRAQKVAGEYFSEHPLGHQIAAE